MARWRGVRTNKYRARTGISKLEAERGRQLRLLEAAGVIAALKEQRTSAKEMRFRISPEGMENLRYTPDALFTLNDPVAYGLPHLPIGTLIAEDAKGRLDTAAVLRMKYFCHYHPGYTLILSYGIYRSVKGKREIVGFRLVPFKDRRQAQYRVAKPKKRRAA